MTQKHYEKIAALIAVQMVGSQARGISVEEAVKEIALGFAKLAGEDNPRFDAQRFLRACGIN